MKLFTPRGAKRERTRFNISSICLLVEKFSGMYV